jgi:hypothetical protein
MTDGTAYNHYSLLRSMEAAFGVPCLGLVQGMRAIAALAAGDRDGLSR